MLENPGLRSQDRYIIIQADDYGISPHANEGIQDMFLSRSITSASIMMPCSWAAEAAAFCKRNAHVNAGIHLTLCSSGDAGYRPVFQGHRAGSVMNRNGFLPREMYTIERYADAMEVKAELDAQIQSAIALGVDPTHLDTHAGCLMGFAVGRDFLELAFELCEQYGLPFNLPRRIVSQPFFSKEQRHLFQQRIAEADRRGIMLIDHIIALPYELEDGEEYGRFKVRMEQEIRATEPGITQILLHPALFSAHARAATPHAEKREWEHRLFSDPQIKELFDQENIRLLSWRELRDAQRSMKGI
ncbi:polysaccharide deacetylase family protein [Paenibacillus oenotherae]|uniref:Polysaccharide deacetylase family protein n=1 Tax=Paenibacillus oenotherae TaxID=1435645 RepID=A0ABS7DD46_9BACL|nr:polysaccharide deacetylase family protein [Paenibacillus oenotherae]MBW7477083.1 polysaccharide deacetylase family protein [Paenibacillus oenotherae]